MILLRRAALIVALLSLGGCDDFIRMEGHDPYADSKPDIIPPGEVRVLMTSSMAAPCTVQIKTADSGDASAGAGAGPSAGAAQPADNGGAGTPAGTPQPAGSGNAAQAGNGEKAAPPPRKAKAAHSFALPEDQAKALAVLKPLHTPDAMTTIIADRPRPSEDCIAKVQNLVNGAGLTRVAHFY